MGALPNEREPLLRYIEAQQISDSEMRVLLRDAATEAKGIIDKQGPGIGRDMRQAQLDVAASQQKMWEKVGYQAEINIGDGVDAASDSAAHMMETYLGSMGVNTIGMQGAMQMQGRAGIDSLVSRRENGIPLSQQVYKSSVDSGEQLDRTINAMILNGASAREIASRVKGFIDPNTPGGSSYAAMRLGRTELNNAFHATSIRLNNENPFVEAMQWHLSGSHPKPDECNEYAERVNFKGGGRGVFHKADVPAKPHPQCLCYITPQVVSDDEFVKNFHNGTYDNYLDKQMGAGRHDPGHINFTKGPKPGAGETHGQARDMFNQIRKEKPGLQDSAYRREAARRMDMDYKEYTRLWKNEPRTKLPKVEVPKPAPLPPITPLPLPVLPPLPPILPAIPKPLPAFTHAQARQAANAVRKIHPEWAEAAVRKAAAEMLDLDYKTYLNLWKKPSKAQLDMPEVLVKLPVDKQWALKPPNPAPKPGGAWSHEDWAGMDMSDINPYRSTGELYWRNNCSSCTSSLEMSWRGFDVAAIPNGGMTTGRNLQDIYDAWGIRVTDQIGVPPSASQQLYYAKHPYSIDAGDIAKHTASLPEGARGFITVEWKTDGAHIYNWQKINGRIRYFDAQVDRILRDGISTLDRAKPRIWMARVDHLPTPSMDRLSNFAANRAHTVATEKARVSAARAQTKYSSRRANETYDEMLQREARERSYERIRLFKEKLEAEKALARAQETSRLARQAVQRAREAEIQAKQAAAFAREDARKAREAILRKQMADRKMISTPMHVQNNLAKQMSSLTSDDLDVLEEYVQGGMFDGVNAGLRGVKLTGGEFSQGGIDMGWVNQTARYLDEAISKGRLSGEATLYRGVADDAIGALKEGAVFTDAGFGSTSLSPEIAKGFGNTLLQITYPAGGNALYIDAVKSLTLGQREVLLPRGLSFKVLSSSIENGKRIIRVQVI